MLIPLSDLSAQYFGLGAFFGYLLILKAYYLFWKDNEYGVKTGDAKRLNVCSVEVCVLLIRGER